MASYYSENNNRKKGRYCRQAVILGENIAFLKSGDRDTVASILLCQAQFLLGQDLFERKKYWEAQENLERSRYLGDLIGISDFDVDIQKYLTEIQRREFSGEIKRNVFNRAVGNLKIGEKLSETAQDVMVKREMKKGEQREEEGDLSAAIVHYEKAINQMKNLGDHNGIANVQVRVAALYDSLDRSREAEAYLSDAILGLEKVEEMIATEKVPDTFGMNLASSSRVQSKETKQHLRSEQAKLKKLASEYARSKDVVKSNYYLKLYEEVSRRVELDSIQSALKAGQRRSQIMLLTQQKERVSQSLRLSEAQNETEIKRRKHISIIAVLILALAMMLSYFYFSKRQQHKKLSSAYSDLNETKNKLEIAELRIRQLLQQQVSTDVASALIAANVSEGGQRKFVCIMFLDIRGFTPIAEKLAPEELIQFQNRTFGYMIDIIQKYHGNVNQLLGDGFMATFGAPVSHGNDCDNAFLAAQEIVSELDTKNANSVHPIRIGIGLHAGDVVAGNVGNEKRKQYSITGNPVIIASRIEQLNKKYSSQLIISKDVYSRLSEPKPDMDFVEEYVKGRSAPVDIAVIS